MNTNDYLIHKYNSSGDWVEKTIVPESGKVLGFDSSLDPSLIAIPVNMYDATFGTGGDYSTLKAAIDAGKYKLKQVGNSTESADITIPQNTKVYINCPSNYTIFFGDYNITNGSNVIFVFDSCILDIRSSTSEKVFATGNTFYFEKCNIIKTNSTVIAPFSNVAYYANYCTITSDNVGGYWAGGSQVPIMTNCNIIGGGSSSNFEKFYGYYNGTYMVVRLMNCNFSGTFIGMCIGGSSTIFDNIYMSCTMGLMIDSCSINNVTAPNAYLYLGESNGKVSNSLFSYVATKNYSTLFRIINTDFSYTSTWSFGYQFNILTEFINCRFNCTGTFSTNSSPGYGMNKFVNCSFAGALTLPDTGNKLQNCYVAGLLTLSGTLNEFTDSRDNGATISNTYNSIKGGEHGAIAINADYNIVQNTVKATSITINSSNRNNIISHNLCDADITIVNGNEITNNITY
jgi:hypothetical protein